MSHIYVKMYAKYMYPNMNKFIVIYVWIYTLYIYIYIYMCVCVCVYMYVCIYISALQKYWNSKDKIALLAVESRH